MAWAAQWFQTPCTVVVPQNNNPEINRFIESCGAELIIHGNDFYDAQFYCDELAAAGYYYVEQGNEPEMLNGLGTMGLEIFEDLADVDVIVCPIGGGAGCASLLRVAQAINPAVQIIGVQAVKAAAYYTSFKRESGPFLKMQRTVADGIGGPQCLPVALCIMKDHVKDVVLLTEEDILEGIRSGDDANAQSRRRRGRRLPRRSAQDQGTARRQKGRSHHVGRQPGPKAPRPCTELIGAGFAVCSGRSFQPIQTDTQEPHANE